MRVIVTRPAAQAAAWVSSFRAWGIDAEALPLIDIVPPADPAPVQRAWAELPRYALLFFVSANAVRHFFELRPQGLAWPPGTRAAAPGPGTAAALTAQGLPAALVVGPAPDAGSFDSEAIWERLRTDDWAGREVLVVRGEDGRDWLAEQLRGAGAALRFVAAYARRPPSLAPEGRQLLADAAQAPQGHLWLFSSSEAVRHLQALWPDGVPAGARALATHPRIAQAAQQAGFAEVGLTGPEAESVRLALQGAPLQSESP